MTEMENARVVAQLIERIGALARSDEAMGGLYPAQWGALRYLARANRFSRTPAAVAKFQGATRGTVAQTILALERKHLVARTPNPRDKRSVTVELTDKGRALLEQDPLVAVAQEIESATVGDLQVVRLRLEAALEGLVRRNGGRMFGLCSGCRHFREGKGDGAETPHRCGLIDVSLGAGEAMQICAEQEPA